MQRGALTDLAYRRTGIWLLQPFSQGCRIELQRASVACSEREIPMDPFPDAIHVLKAGIGIFTL